VSLGSIFMVYTHSSITRVFFITAASFGALSLWGYTTQRDISGWGSVPVHGLVGIIIAMLVNIGIAAFTGQSSTMLQWIISVVGVLVFAGLTAYDTQRLKSEYIYGAMEGDVLERSAIMGALSLYLDFLNLFTMLLLAARQPRRVAALTIVTMTAPAKPGPFHFDPPRGPSGARLIPALDSPLGEAPIGCSRLGLSARTPEPTRRMLPCRTMIGTSRPSRAPAPDNR
jgi:hypothetical protein